MTTALMAGLFFFWSIVIMPGLQKLNDLQYVEAMQNFNKEILNPAFFIIFLGSIFLLPLSTFLEYKNGNPQKFKLLLIASLIYFAGVVLITFFKNIPLNNTLEAFNLQSSEAAYIEIRNTFENPWNRFNWVRTISSFGTLILVLFTLIKK